MKEGLERQYIPCDKCWNLFLAVILGVVTSAGYCTREARCSRGSTGKKHWVIPLSDTKFGFGWASGLTGVSLLRG